MNAKTLPRVSIVTVNYRQPEVTCDLLRSLCDLTYPDLEVILVDNGMVEDQTARFESCAPAGTRIILSEENLGFAGGANLGIRQSTGSLILLLNNDTVAPPGFLEPMVELMASDERIGMISPKIYFYDQPDVLQFAGATEINTFTGRGRKIGFHQKDDGSFDYTGEVGLGNGACMLVRRSVFEEVGLLSELYFMYYEEHDFTERAKRAGWKMYYTGNSYIHHKQSMSMGKSNPRKTYYLSRNRLLFMRRILQGGKFYLFLTYYLLIGLPKTLFRHLRRGEIDHMYSTLRGLFWNINKRKIQYQHEGITF